MKNLLILTMKLVLLLTLQACSRSESPGDAADPGSPEALGLSTLTGTVSHYQMDRLPPDAVIHVELRDVTEGVGNAQVLASSQITSGKRSPHTFELVYDARLVQEGRSYRVAAELRDSQRVLDDSAGSVDPFAVDAITLVFDAPVAVTSSKRLRTYSLQGIRWQLAELGAEPVNTADIQEMPYLEVQEDEPRFGGSAGCNNYSGSYELNGTRISLSQVIATRKACAKGMELESAYMAMLGQVGSWRMDGITLVLGDADRQALARFVAVD